PYFIECEYSRGGSLVDWSDAQGGLGRLLLSTRLDLAAQIAEALAAAHAVGVLHKDVKPRNVLIDQAEGAAPRIKLADFGSGDVHKMLAPGWESRIEDELLREDIAAAAQGDPALRLADAAALATRLRTLGARRTQRAAERAAHTAAAEQQRTIERLRALRAWM